MSASALLRCLKDHAPDWVSSEVLRQPSGVSRAAISKQIRKLTEMGYDIESSPRKGYRLVREPDRMSEDVLQAWLEGTRFAKGEHRFLELTESTNDDARTLAREGAEEGSFVFSEVQEKGRGRQGRKWLARAGDTLLGSVLLRPPLRPQEATLLPLVAATAINTALREAGLQGSGIKWPNDVLIDGRKVCGILCEMSVDMDGIEFAVLGFGLNVHTPAIAFPPELQEIACSLFSVTGHSWNRPELAGRILRELDRLLTLTYSGKRRQVLDEWRQGSVTLGQEVTITRTDGHQEFGVAQDVDEAGALVVHLYDGSLKTFHSGEVSLRPKA